MLVGCCPHIPSGPRSILVKELKRCKGEDAVQQIVMRESQLDEVVLKTPSPVRVVSCQRMSVPEFQQLEVSKTVLIEWSPCQSRGGKATRQVVAFAISTLWVDFVALR